MKEQLKKEYITRKTKGFDDETKSQYLEFINIDFENWYEGYTEGLKKLNYETLVAIGEACLFMQGYKGSCTKEGEWSEWDEEVLKKLEKIIIDGNGASGKTGA